MILEYECRTRSLKFYNCTEDYPRVLRPFVPTTTLAVYTPL